MCVWFYDFPVVSILFRKIYFPLPQFLGTVCYFPLKRNLIDMALAACAWGSGSANLFIVRDRAVNPDLLLH